MTYIPTALSAREDALLRKYARGRTVTEAGALLGHSTIEIAQTAERVVSIDRHSGYQHWRNDTERQFRRNLEVAGVAQRVEPIVADFAVMELFPAEFVFIDLDGTFDTTLAALVLAQAPLIGVHDYERHCCKGVERAVRACGLKVIERADSLVILERPPK